jgi:hypothetical protein
VSNQQKVLSLGKLPEQQRQRETRKASWDMNSLLKTRFFMMVGIASLSQLNAEEAIGVVARGFHSSLSFRQKNKAATFIQ